MVSNPLQEHDKLSYDVKGMQQEILQLLGKQNWMAGNGLSNEE